MHTNYHTYLNHIDFPDEPEFWNEETSRLVCFETNDWDSEHSLAVKPYLQAMSTTLLHPFLLQHTFIDSEDSLYRGAKHPNAIGSQAPFIYVVAHGMPGAGAKHPNAIGSQAPFIYVVAHGMPGAILYNDFDGSGLDALVFPFESQIEVKRVIYIGACSIFGKSDGDFLAKRLLEKSKCEAVIGYTENAGWYNSNFTEMLFISRFYNSPSPFYELEEIYNSVINDFAPTRKIGLKMFSRKSIGN